MALTTKQTRERMIQHMIAAREALNVALERGTDSPEQHKALALAREELNRADARRGLLEMQREDSRSRLRVVSGGGK